MLGPVTPVPPWMAKVNHKKAPGAISAMAFIVKPVSPNVGFISGELSAMYDLLNKKSTNLKNRQINA
jgi:hypothetical protein